MALTNQQMNDAAYLTSLVKSLNKQKQNALAQNTANYENSMRQNNMTLQQNLRREKELNARNGINGGFEESTYARLLAGANKGAADLQAQMNDAAYKIGAQYDPQIGEYQGYLDRLNAIQAAQALASSGGGGGSVSNSGNTKGNTYWPAAYYRGEKTDSLNQDATATNSLAASLAARAYKNQGMTTEQANQKVRQTIAYQPSEYVSNATKNDINRYTESLVRQGYSDGQIKSRLKAAGYK